MLINPGSGPNTPDHEWKPLKLLSQEKSENRKIDLSAVNGRCLNGVIGNHCI